MSSRILFAVCMLLLSSTAVADATVPTEDIPGARDTDVVGRLAGSFIVAYSHMDYDEVSLPLTPLEEVEGARDEKNNRVYRPLESIDLEGSRTHLVYVLPDGASPLQVVRNYENMLTGVGGDVRFECKREECGGASDRSSGGGGGQQSMAMFLWPESRIKQGHFTNGHCAQTERIADQRYALIELPERRGFVSVLAYVLRNDSYCKALNGRVVAVVDVVEEAAMGDSMVTIDAREMARSIAETGSVALYGIYFDFGKASLRPESAATLENIARLLNDSPGLRVLVVGHTDSVGSFQSNQTLSERRAAAVVDALTSEYRIDRARLRPVGVSYAAPKASNSTDEGRALNRRVELVED
ncbi:outer membrane protein/peptidoglycan-associated (lipo)protein [Thioflavicoccus mobilis 8321]|uniref:Outer membrane protein/peptidoglycan-associated (Lipo)protein n=1 Tax=Thioflavicoccus mobilis 8321 TaxID=765912 RepID=L0H0P4_9GAMM|nr:OmpA family protein [Thioflavicoccus mobilis]AGA91632.1 outer membrane protein/peptidoglycan-associated (lipo)protein [Thioflavicoccus mobilis 8321]